MISKKYIKQLEFKTIEEFYNYVFESAINGNYTQTKELIKKMTDKQFIQFNEYLGEMGQLDYKFSFLNMRFSQ